MFFLFKRGLYILHSQIPYIGEEPIMAALKPFAYRLFALGSVLLWRWIPPLHCTVALCKLPHSIVVHLCTFWGFPSCLLSFLSLLCSSVLGNFAAKPRGLQKIRFSQSYSYGSTVAIFSLLKLTTEHHIMVYIVLSQYVLNSLNSQLSLLKISLQKALEAYFHN